MTIFMTKSFCMILKSDRIPSDLIRSDRTSVYCWKESKRDFIKNLFRFHFIYRSKILFPKIPYQLIFNALSHRSLKISQLPIRQVSISLLIVVKFTSTTRKSVNLPQNDLVSVLSPKGQKDLNSISTLQKATLFWVGKVISVWSGKLSKSQKQIIKLETIKFFIFLD